METSYDIRIWKTQVYRGARTTTYTVRWSVAAGRGKSRSGRPLAEAFRSELVTAARRGEAFGIESGRPVSMERAERQVSWFDFAREYAQIKWPHLAPNSRRNTARALTVGTLAMVTESRGRPNRRRAAEGAHRVGIQPGNARQGAAARGRADAHVARSEYPACRRPGAAGGGADRPRCADPQE
jgi:hypothetical protein